ncbi:hypothetical protein K1719_025434 [Acacia pycnantha]|nr:hypothetical protein K1719_025434 [Acacia pycnantha]
MLPVSFESSPKSNLPPHPGEDQSTKRAKLDDVPPMDTIMASVQTSDLASPEAHVSPSGPAAEFVPETQPSATATPLAEDVLMEDDNVNLVSNVKVPSFKEKLLNLDSNATEDEQDDISLQQGDVSIGLNGNIPTVDFAEHVKETLNRKMGLAVVIKLLGRKIGYRQLRTQLQKIWKPSGHFKLTDMDEDCFLVRFQDDLDYQNAILTGPWMVYGHYLSVQPWTPSFKPTNHVINQVMGWIGKYRHLQEACPAKLASSSGEVPLASETNIPKPDLQARESSLFRSWMQVQRRRRLPARGDKANEA